MTTLNEKNAKQGMIIENNSHPEWGTFILQDYNDRNDCGWWNIRGDRGVKVLYTSEMCFWNVVK
jgi:hypothetical protein